MQAKHQCTQNKTNKLLKKKKNLQLRTKWTVYRRSNLLELDPKEQGFIWKKENKSYMNRYKKRELLKLKAQSG